MSGICNSNAERRLRAKGTEDLRDKQVDAFEIGEILAAGSGLCLCSRLTN
jgi:hypothetical protein